MTEQTISFDSPYNENIVEAVVKMEGNIVELFKISSQPSEQQDRTPVKILIADINKLKAFHDVQLIDIDAKYIPVKLPYSNNWNRRHIFKSLKVQLKEILSVSKIESNE